MFARKVTRDARARGEHRVEPREHVQLRVDRLRDLHVRVVAAGPEERLNTGDLLDVLDVDPARLEDGELLGAEVVADHADNPHVGEEARRQREVRRRTAEDAFTSSERRLDGVERDGADDGDGHRFLYTTCASRASPAASRSSSALSVRSHVKS